MNITVHLGGVHWIHTARCAVSLQCPVEHYGLLISAMSIDAVMLWSVVSIFFMPVHLYRLYLECFCLFKDLALTGLYEVPSNLCRLALVL